MKRKTKCHNCKYEDTLIISHRHSGQGYVEIGCEHCRQYVRIDNVSLFDNDIIKRKYKNKIYTITHKGKDTASFN